MIYILEGPDGAGKSTLAKQLQEQTGFEIVHRSKPKSEEEKKEMLAMYAVSIMNNDNVIFDRAWYSEMVYGPIMRDITCISMDTMYKLEKMLKIKGGIVIHCTDSIEKLWKRCEKRGEDYIRDVGQLAKIKMAYMDLFHNVPHEIPIVRYVLSETPVHQL